MRKFLLPAALIAAGLVSPAAFAADTAAAPAKAALSTAETDIGTLMDNAEAKAIVDKHLPGFSTNPQIEMARAMTIRAIQQFVPDQLTNEKLDAIDADLAKLAAK